MLGHSEFLLGGFFCCTASKPDILCGSIEGVLAMYDIIVNGIVFETVSSLEIAMFYTVKYRSQGMNAVYHPHLGDSLVFL